MTQAQVFEDAKQGSVRAIATVVSWRLQSQGVTVKGNLRDDCLHVLLESATIPDQQTLVPQVHQQVEQLDIRLRRLIVYGRQRGLMNPDWVHEIPLTPSSGSTSSESVPDDSSLASLSQPVFQSASMASSPLSTATAQVSRPQLAKRLTMALWMAGIVLGVVWLYQGYSQGNPQGTLADTPTIPANRVPSEQESPVIPDQSSATAGTAVGETAANTAVNSDSIPPLSSPAKSPESSANSSGGNFPGTSSSGTNQPLENSPSIESPDGVSTPEVAAVTQSDPYRAALQHGQEAALSVQTAQSSDDWNTVVNRWRHAIGFLQIVPSAHSQYAQVPEKLAEYQNYLDYAQRQQAEALAREAQEGQ